MEWGPVQCGHYTAIVEADPLFSTACGLLRRGNRQSQGTRFPVSARSSIRRRTPRWRFVLMPPRGSRTCGVKRPSRSARSRAWSFCSVSRIGERPLEGLRHLADDQLVATIVRGQGRVDLVDRRVLPVPSLRHAETCRAQDGPVREGAPAGLAHRARPEPDRAALHEDDRRGPGWFVRLERRQPAFEIGLLGVQPGQRPAKERGLAAAGRPVRPPTPRCGGRAAPAGGRPGAVARRRALPAATGLLTPPARRDRVCGRASRRRIVARPEPPDPSRIASECQGRPEGAPGTANASRSARLAWYPAGVWSASSAAVSQFRSRIRVFWLRPV